MLFIVSICWNGVGVGIAWLFDRVIGIERRVFAMPPPGRTEPVMTFALSVPIFTVCSVFISFEEVYWIQSVPVKVEPMVFDVRGQRKWRKEI